MRKAEPIRIKKDDQVIATADSCSQQVIPGDGWEGVDQIDCYYFNRVSLTPPVMFEHLAGVGLGKFFNGSQIHFPDSETVAELRYVHGKSEVLKGKHTVSAVLLARPKPENGVSDVVWLTHLPDIYKRFIVHHDQGAKKV
jgi:hypothetical protein